MKRITDLIESGHHALAVEWSAPDIEQLSSLLTTEARRRNVTLHMLVFETHTFTIDTARHIKEAQSRRPVPGEETSIVVSARSFLTEAQNTLLKSLEEPTRGVHIILITPSLSSLLDTVLSRAAHLRIEDDTSAKERKDDFFGLSHKERLDRVSSILKDDTKEAHLAFLEEREHEISRYLATETYDRISLTTLGKKIMRAKRLILTGNTASKYLLEDIALSIPDPL